MMVESVQSIELVMVGVWDTTVSLCADTLCDRGREGERGRGGGGKREWGREGEGGRKRGGVCVCVCVCVCVREREREREREPTPSHISYHRPSSSPNYQPQTALSTFQLINTSQ